MKISLCLILLFIASNIYAQKNYKSFEGYIGKEGYYTQSSEAENFFDFIMDSKGKIVYLMIFLDDEQDGNVSQEPDDFSRLTFTADFKDSEGYNSGAEYLIHITKSNKEYFEYNKTAKRLEGYFKVWDIVGPHQGLFSINLRPVKVN